MNTRLSHISRSNDPPPTEAAPKRLSPPITTDEAARWTERSMLSGSPKTDGCGGKQKWGQKKRSQTKPRQFVETNDAV